MRLLAILFLLVLVWLGATLGMEVMQGAGAGARPAIATMPATLGGRPQGHVYTGVSGEPSDVNPLTTYDPLAMRLVQPYTHDALLDQDPESGQLRPALADQFVVSDDGMSCLFRLREGVLFSDGAELTMADALFGWELAQAGHLILGAMAQCFERVAQVEVLDNRRFRVVFQGGGFSTTNAVGLSWLVAQKAFFVEAVRRRLAFDQARQRQHTLRLDAGGAFGVRVAREASRERALALAQRLESEAHPARVHAWESTGEPVFDVYLLDFDGYIEAADRAFALSQQQLAPEVVPLAIFDPSEWTAPPARAQ